MTRKYGGNWYPSSVGEVNVVARMKEKGAVIGGEGNGESYSHNSIMEGMLL
ncbi:MAG: hypothetical protein R2744_07680 [Bacteroidales bacterium]